MQSQLSDTSIQPSLPRKPRASFSNPLSHESNNSTKSDDELIPDRNPGFKGVGQSNEPERLRKQSSHYMVLNRCVGTCLSHKDDNLIQAHLFMEPSPI